MNADTPTTKPRRSSTGPPAETGDRSARSTSDRDALTLGEHQAIGREVGVAPERIAEAVRSIERRPALMVTRATRLGIPYAVGRT